MGFTEGDALCDKELREIIRNQRKLVDPDPSLRKKATRSRSILPYQAHAQLMEEPMNISDLLGTKFRGNYDTGKQKNWGWEKQVQRQRMGSRL